MALLYLPASQSKHAVFAAFWYLPASHGLHVDDEVAPTVTEILPSGQSKQELLEADHWYLPASQSKHAVFAAFWYLPASHGSHVDDETPEISPSGQ